MRLSSLAYYSDFYISAALITVMASIAAMTANWINGGYWVAYIVLGAVTWTLLEYLIHRWIYHQAPYFRDLHDAHHRAPADHIGSPPVIGIALIYVVFFLPIAPVSPIAAGGITTGVLLGYMGYMLVHHADHYWKPEPSSPMYKLCRHHALHHHRSDEGNFGITTIFWDQAFGTALEFSKRPGTE